MRGKEKATGVSGGGDKCIYEDLCNYPKQCQILSELYCFVVEHQAKKEYRNQNSWLLDLSRAETRAYFERAILLKVAAVVGIANLLLYFALS